MTGIITYYNYVKGFGFILSGDQRIFFHVSSIQGRATVGARVEFEMGDSFHLGKPKQAINIRVIEDATSQAAQKLAETVQEGGTGGVS